MERVIGEVFEFKGEKYKVEEVCSGCEKCNEKQKANLHFDE